MSNVTQEFIEMMEGLASCSPVERSYLLGLREGLGLVRDSPQYKALKASAPSASSEKQEQADPTEATPDKDGWLPNPGKQPVGDDVMVEVRLSGIDPQEKVRMASRWEWGMGDVIAPITEYRIVQDKKPERLTLWDFLEATHMLGPVDFVLSFSEYLENRGK